ncbi:MAG: alpha/beta hydrolase [Thermoleophilaceae bacterium]|nr:alpha/beta hydrolase [Thermoleophilaceae bacterium]
MVSRARILAALLVVIVLAGCQVPRPPGPEPLRYRDTVFSAATVTSNLVYGSAPDGAGNPVTLTLDVYRPAGDSQTKRPALVWVHGGSFRSGSKTDFVPTDVANTFARLGYVVVSINYRLLAPNTCIANPGQAACITAAIEAQHDAQAAVRWLRANAGTYGVDPTRVAIGGESAGGITATLVGLRRDDPGTSGNPGPSSTVGGFVSVSGGVPSGAFVDSGDSPGLLFHGTADRTVSPSWSRDTADALLRAHVPFSYQVQEGAGHVPWGQYRTLYLTQSNYFLYQQLDLAHAAGQPQSATARRR